MTRSYLLGKTLITGAGGMLGTALTELLEREAGAQIFGLTRTQVDLRNFQDTLAVFKACKPVTLFHLAARVAGVGGNVADPYGMFYENVSINTNVIEAARRTDVRRIVAVGTSAIYSDEVSLPMREEHLWNGAPHRSEAPYGHAKRAMLVHLEACQAQYGIDFSYAILTNAYGPNDRFNAQRGHVIPSLLVKIAIATRKGSDLEVWGTGRPTRDFIFSEDVARALVILGYQPSGPVNVATGQEITIRELVDLMVEVTEFRGKILWNPTKPDGQMNRRYDVTRLKGIGFKPEYTISAGLRKTYRWLQQNLDLARR